MYNEAMDYELAKELKEAGFSQDGKLFYWSDHTTPSTHWSVAVLPEQLNGFEPIASPTLEELIEACGEDFGAVCRISDGMWSAATPVRHSGVDYLNPHIEVTESTPLNAVARLWLALNKK